MSTGEHIRKQVGRPKVQDPLRIVGQLAEFVRRTGIKSRCTDWDIRAIVANFGEEDRRNVLTLRRIMRKVK